MKAAMTRNEQLFEQSQKVIPGGVNSPVRAFKSVGGTPVFFSRAKGSRVWDADGREYIDYVGSWGPAILGHAHPGTVKAVQDAAANGRRSARPPRPNSPSPTVSRSCCRASRRCVSCRPAPKRP